jgi:hypothetical protein
MCKHEEKECPRCKNVFECKAGSITQCQCSQLKLSVSETAFIESQYDDCLCLACLQALKLELRSNKKT